MAIKLIPTVVKNKIVVSKNKAYYDGNIVPACGQKHVLLDKKKTDKGKIEVTNREDLLDNVVVEFC